MFYATKDDFLNKHNLRNFFNTNRHDYNCAGYALGCYSWYTPFGDLAYDYISNEKEDEIDYESDQDIYLKNCTKQLLHDFPNLTLIKKENIDKYKNKEIIAFRLSEFDFHFIIRKLNGHWYQKMGITWEIKRVTKEKVFADEWDGDGLQYDSEIAFFVKN